MKITAKILSIPPYISTQWEYVTSIRLVDTILIVALKDGSSCSIPNLPQNVIDEVFTYHSASLEEANHQKEELTTVLEGVKTGFTDLFTTLGKLGATTMGSIGKSLEHDPKNTHLPPIPPEMEEKVRLLLNIIPEEDVLAMPEAVPGCNCMYCQINRILRQAVLERHPEEKPDILPDQETKQPEDKELEFSEWVVESLADKMYKVTNKLDPKEEYRVFLGNPIGCTCGKQHCEHILAVLRS
jgi:hypothetical protein